MIALLTGRVAVKMPGQAIVDVNGVGYRLLMSTGSLAALPAEGDEVTVHTHLYVREDELTLFGFESTEERAAFEHLLTVSGVGPKVALGVLSALSAEDLARAIAAEDAAMLSTVPGVGKKTAQRIILDLADKLGSDEIGRGHGKPSRGAQAETRDALLAMGFSAAEVAAALGGTPENTESSELLRIALKRLGGGA